MRTSPHLSARDRFADAAAQRAPSPTVSVVIPTRNEAANVGWVLQRIPPIVDEVIVVDGLSTDGTIEAARAARPDVIVVEERRPGKGAALQAGFAAAKGDVVAMLDADGSMDPAEITRLVDRLDPDVGLVKGSRFLRAPGAGTADMTRVRRMGNSSLLRLVNHLHRSTLTDLCYGLCAFHRSDLEVLSIDAVGFEVETQIILRALHANMRIEEVPSFEAERHDGVSKLHPCRDGIRVLHTVARERHAQARPVARPAMTGVGAAQGQALTRPSTPAAALRARAEASLPMAAPAIAVLIWAASLAQIHPEAMGGTGLISVLPVATFVALALVTVSFGVCLGRTSLDTRVLAVHVVALIVMLYGTTAIVEPHPAFEPAYRHVGIASLIGAGGGVDTTIDAYFNWPGFFIVAAFITHEAGLSSALSLVPWAPLFFNLLYLGPLLLIFGSLNALRRVAWLALWLFYITNWSAQDYFSPQATAYFLFLVVIAVLLRWFTPPAERATPKQRAGLLAVAISACIAIVPMHQLTPFALLASVTALVVFAGCTARLLPVLIAVLIAGWEAYMTVSFLSGNVSQLLGSVGNLGGTVQSNVGDRIGGDPAHRLVVEARLLLTAALWALAAAGWWTLRGRGRPRAAAAALALAPVPLIALQPYGGEIVIRVSLFALPFVSLLASYALVAALDVPSPRAIAGIVTVSIVLLTGFLFARYGNERADSFSPGDVAGVRALYRMAPPGSQLLAVSQPLPWQAQDYDTYNYQRLTNLLPNATGRPDAPRRPLSAQIRDVMRQASPRRSFLIVTRSQIAGDELFGSRIASARTVAATLRASRIFRVAYANPDASIFVLNRRGKAGGA